MHRRLYWLTAAVMMCIIFGTIYLVLQQSERQGANDAPSRLASQIASQLRSKDSEAPPRASEVKLEDSDALFYVVYDEHDRSQSGTAQLRGALATVPLGVINVARSTGSDRVTWQPPGQLRFALVAISVGSHVVVAGQSLIPTEQRIDQIGILVGAAWGIAILLLGIGFAVDRRLDARPT